jgi:hypothetical protein
LILSCTSRFIGRWPGQSHASAGHLFVDVTPEPALVGLCGADYGVLGSLVVLGRVAVFGGVAAAYVAAFEAGAQVYPFVAERDALRADVGVGRDVFAVFEVSAERHGVSFEIDADGSKVCRQKESWVPGAESRVSNAVNVRAEAWTYLRRYWREARTYLRSRLRQILIQGL